MHQLHFSISHGSFFFNETQAAMFAGCRERVSVKEEEEKMREEKF